MSAARDWRAASLRQTPVNRQKIADALGVAHPYALAPFAIMQTERGPRLAAALEPPPLLNAEDLTAWDADPDSDVIEIDWRTGAVVLMGEPGGWLCGDPTPRALSEQRGRLGGMLLAGANEPQIESQTRVTVSLFQLIAGGDPSGGAGVCAVPAVAAERRGSAIRARHRPVS